MGEALPQQLKDQLQARVRQQDFAELVGISQQAVSQLIQKGALEPGDTLDRWLLAYCERLRDQAAGRDADGSLAKERAALARVQRVGQEIRNNKEMGEWAPIGLLGDVLALASQAVTDRFDSLEGSIRKACPDLPGEALNQIRRVIVNARAEWIRSTAQLVDQALDAVTEDEPYDQGEPELADTDDDESATAP
ncbi:MAG: hypothetical protein AB7U92_23500 [Piscinibacter sp.]|uniref:hypothetical protein n=1 Tax=Piscinibacter sp. TaxID=1903157 RepID=UPI003D0E2AAA